MMKNLRKLFLSVLIASSSASVALAAPSFKVSASLDSATLLMGYTTRLRLQVEQNEGDRVTLPILREYAGQQYIPLLNDSVELSPQYKLDTVRLSQGRIRVNYDMTVQAFDSGYYKLPEFLFVNGADTARTNRVDLKVIPVKVADDAEISGFTSIEEPEEEMKSDLAKSPAVHWLKKYWWLVALAVLVLVGGFWAFRRYRTKGTLLPVKPPVPPIDEAKESFRRLEQKQLWQKGKEKEYYTALTFIIRRYLSKEYQIPAMEMTSGQIMKALKADPDLRQGRDAMRKILDMADFVKFAKVRPLPDDNEECFSLAKDFVNESHRLWTEKQRQIEEQQRREKARQEKPKEKSTDKKKSGKSGSDRRRNKK